METGKHVTEYIYLQEMPGGVDRQNNVLTVTSMRRDHMGWYQCLASDGNNRALTRKTKINLLRECRVNSLNFTKITGPERLFIVSSH